MRTLKSVLQQAAPDMTSLGGGRQVDREQLVELLGGLMRDLGKAYWMRVILVFVVLAVLLGALLRFSDQPAMLGIAGAGMGITFVGALAAVKQVTDELARVGLVLVLAAEVSLDSLNEMMRRIIAGP